MNNWTPEAIEAAHLAMFQEPYDGTTAPMIGSGLDAAAAAQGIKDEEITRLRSELTDYKDAAASEAERVNELTAENGSLREEIAQLRGEVADLRVTLRNCLTDLNFMRAAAAFMRAAAAAIREGGE